MTKPSIRAKQGLLPTGSVRRNILFVLPLLPGFVALGACFLYPLVETLKLSLKPSPNIIGYGPLANYKWVLGDPYTWKVLLQTGKLAMTTTGVTLLLGYPVAYYLARSSSKLRYFVFIAVISPLLVSIVVRTFGWVILLGAYGIINTLLMQLGIISRPILFLYNFGATVLGLVHVFLPFMVLSIVGVLSKIDNTVLESAASLGAAPWKVFLRITFPLSLQGVISGSILVFSLSLGAYLTPALLGGGKVVVLTTEIFDQMMSLMDWKLGAAIGVILLLLATGLFSANSFLVGRWDWRAKSER